MTPPTDEARLHDALVEVSLDVERLTRAIKARRDLAPYRPSQESFLMVDWLEYADAIAAEYARLSEASPDE